MLFGPQKTLARGANMESREKSVCSVVYLHKLFEVNISSNVNGVLVLSRPLQRVLDPLISSTL